MNKKWDTRSLARIAPDIEKDRRNKLSHQRLVPRLEEFLGAQKAERLERRWKRNT